MFVITACRDNRNYYGPDVTKYLIFCCTQHMYFIDCKLLHANTFKGIPILETSVIANQTAMFQYNLFRRQKSSFKKTKRNQVVGLAAQKVVNTEKTVVYCTDSSLICDAILTSLPRFKILT